MSHVYMKPYLDFSEYLRKTFSTKVQKISLNAYLSCPNRDGKDGLKGGCTYCNNRSFSPGYTQERHSISQQLREGIEFFSRKYPTMKYIAYFQSYTNTYGDTGKLIDLYEEALMDPNVVGLFVGTRPDCISEELLDYFEQLSKQTTIFLEYGIESTKEETLRLIRRGHTYQDSVDAIIATASHGIPCGAHLIIGLPGESEEDFIHHIHRLNALPITYLKLHQLQIIKGTALGREYLEDPEKIPLFSLDDYLATTAKLLRALRPDIYVDRFTSQSPKNLLIAPKWDIKNYVFTDKLIALMNQNGYHQGDLYEQNEE